MPSDSQYAAGAQILGSALNSVSAANLNKRNRRFSEYMYNIQKADAERFWNMQNEYNSPAAQMQRFKDAGLNPHLIYGQGNPGNAGSIDTPGFSQPQSHDPQWGNAVSGGLSMLSTIADLGIKQAQTDNLKAQNDVLVQEALLKGIQTSTGQFDLQFKKDLRDTDASARVAALHNLKTQTDLSVRADARAAIQNSTSIAEALERMKSMQEQRANMRVQRTQSRAEIARIYSDTRRIKQTISLLQKDNIVKELDAEIAKMNIRPGDPWWLRTIGTILTPLIDFFSDDGAK